MKKPFSWNDQMPPKGWAVRSAKKTATPHRIDYWRLRDLLRLHLYQTAAIRASVLGGWFVPLHR